MRTKSKSIVAALLALLVIALLAYGLGWSKLFAVDSISFQGTDRIELITNQLSQAKSNLIIGEPLARVNPRTQEKIITELEWVASAKMTRNWRSGRVVIEIEPRIPVAVFSQLDLKSNQPRYLGSDGVEFSDPKSYSNLAVISLGQATLDQRKQVAYFVSNLPGNLVSALSGIEISKTGVIKMQSNLRKPDLNIIWGSDNSATDITMKSRVLIGLLALPENKKISEIDLTFVDSPIVK